MFNFLWPLSPDGSLSQKRALGEEDKPISPFVVSFASSCTSLMSSSSSSVSASLRDSFTARAPVIPAIQSLIPELLTHIFLLSLPEGTDFPNPLSPNSPSKFLSICRHWRNVTLETPLLWCRIYILNPRGNEDVENRYLRFVRLYMTRSKNALLSFTWHGKVQSEIVWELIKHKQRWKFVHIVVENANVLRDFTNAMAHGVPFLEVAKIFSIYAPIYSQVICHSPNLIRLEIVHGFIGKIPEEAPEFKRLRHLRIGGHLKKRNFLHDYHIPLIRRCPSLESLVVDFFDMPASEQEHDSEDTLSGNLHIDLPFLTDLTVHCFFGQNSSSTHVRLFLRHIRASSLCNLQLMLAGDFAPDHRAQEHGMLAESICEFLNRSGARPEKYSVDARTFDFEAFQKILRGMPTLKGLKIPCKLADDQLMEALTLPSMTNGHARKSYLCPSLTDLKMVVDRRLSCQALEAMIVSRCQQSRLQDVSRETESSSQFRYASGLCNVSITYLSSAESLDHLKLNPIIVDAISSGLKLEIRSATVTGTLALRR